MTAGRAVPAACYGCATEPKVSAHAGNARSREVGIAPKASRGSVRTSASSRSIPCRPAHLKNARLRPAGVMTTAALWLSTCGMSCGGRWPPSGACRAAFLLGGRALPFPCVFRYSSGSLPVFRALRAGVSITLRVTNASPLLRDAAHWPPSCGRKTQGNGEIEGLPRPIERNLQGSKSLGPVIFEVNKPIGALR